MKLLRKILFVFVLLFPISAKAETLIIPVQDLLIEVPNFQAPTYDFNAGLNGEYAISDIPKSRRERRIMERKLIDLAYEIYPDAESIRIWRGTFIIKLPEINP